MDSIEEIYEELYRELKAETERQVCVMQSALDRVDKMIEKVKEEENDAISKAS